MSKLHKSFALCASFLLALGCSSGWGQAALLLEEPYSYDATFAGTGHSAVYLARVCAASPFQLRRCELGEKGVVISRYHGIAGHDWVAVPLIPYLYAVEKPEDIPLYVDTKLVALLRERYLSSLPLPPEERPGAEPRYELAGSAYDRTLYGFRIATTAEQDDALIRTLNASPNNGAYTLLKRNCADFSKQIINFYYPHAVHRSIIADLGVTTPKQTAKSLVRYSKHHRQTQLTTFIIPQVPGLKRSHPVHGVLETLFYQKKYITPVLIFHPYAVGGVEAAYWAGWRFNPAKGARIFNPSDPHPVGNLGAPLTASQRKSYANMIATVRKSEELSDLPQWSELLGHGKPQLDAEGKPLVRISLDGRDIAVGLCRGNALHVGGSPELVQNLLLSHMDAELKAKKPSTSKAVFEENWSLLQSAGEASQVRLNAAAGTN